MTNPETAITFQFREAREHDFDAIAEITNHYIRCTPIHFGLEPTTADAMRADWRKATSPARGPAYPWLVAVTNDGTDRLAGYAKASLWRERAAYRLTAETAIYIDQPFQSQGLGRRLYTRLIEACREAGYHTLIAVATIPNAGSVGLHRSTGFTCVGDVREAGRKFDIWHDVRIWQKML